MRHIGTFKAVMLPPDPEDMNDQRAIWAINAVAQFGYATGECFETFKGEQRSEILEQNISDLLCNLAHLCDREGIDIRAMLERAENHYNEETDNKGEQWLL